MRASAPPRDPLRCRAAAKAKGKAAKPGASPPSPPPRPAPWQSPEVVLHTLALIDSYRRSSGEPLLPPGASVVDAARLLFEAPFVCVSHGTEAQPVFNYGNAAALNLWGLSWEQFTALESSRSAPAEAGTQADRSAALSAAGASGCVRDYGGVRVTAAGRRFRLEGATLWRVSLPPGKGEESEQAGSALGAAARFGRVVWLDAGEPGAPGEAFAFAPGGALVPEQAGAPEAAEAPPTPVSAAALGREAAVARASVDALAGAVRALKADAESHPDDVAVAVKKLLAAKERLAQADAALAAAGGAGGDGPAP